MITTDDRPDTKMRAGSNPTQTQPQPVLTTAGCGEMTIDSNEQKGSRFSGHIDTVKERFGDAREQFKGPWTWNKIGMTAGAAAAVVGAAYAARKLLSSNDEDFQMRLETDENLRLISSKKVEGTPVLGREGEKIGMIDNFMVDKYTGRVAYAVMSLSGTWGFGSSLFPLPWPVLEYNEEAGGYKLDVTRDEMKDAPRFEEASQPEFDPAYRRQVILFYRPS